MNAQTKDLLANTGGALAAGIAIKTVNSPITPVALLAIGTAVAMKSKGDLKNFGQGIAAIGAIGTLGKVAEKVEALQKFTPTISGMGDLYEDEDGNIIDLNGVNGPELVQDQDGTTYMVGGLYGDEFDEYEEVEGLAGADELKDLV